MPTRQAAKTDNPEGTQRLDKWLWYCRVTKTRTLATTLVQSGKVRVNRARTQKPGQTVRPDDVVTIAVHGKVRVLRVVAAGTRRGPAIEAATLFEELTQQRTAAGPVAGTQAGRTPGEAASVRAGGERPTKRDRRAIDRLQARTRRS